MNALPSFYSPRPLDEQALHRLAPSIFTEEAHPDRSARFAPIPTIEVVRELAKANYLPYAATQNRVRSHDRSPFTKHMIKFRRPEDRERHMRAVGDTMLEVILVNANDGTARYHLDAGMFKLACLNGLIVKSQDYGSVTIRHLGANVPAKVLEGTRTIMDNADKVLRTPFEWSKVVMSDRLRRAFAASAHRARFGNDAVPHLTLDEILKPRRDEDRGRDLWSTFNVIQENLVAGGLQAHRLGARPRTMRGITGIDNNIALNKRLWELAESFAKEQA